MVQESDAELDVRILRGGGEGYITVESTGDGRHEPVRGWVRLPLETRGRQPSPAHDQR
jgi:hypothetical protein